MKLTHGEKSQVVSCGWVMARGCLETLYLCLSHCYRVEHVENQLPSPSCVPFALCRYCTHQDAEFLFCWVLDRVFFGPPFPLSAPMYTLVSPAYVHLAMDRMGLVLQDSQLLGIGFPISSQLSIQWRYKWKSFSVLRKDLIINTSLSVEVHNIAHICLLLSTAVCLSLNYSVLQFPCSALG